MSEVMTIDDLAKEIRRVNGTHSLGAGALAEALMPLIDAQLAKAVDLTGYRVKFMTLLAEAWVHDKTEGEIGDQCIKYFDELAALTHPRPSGDEDEDEVVDHDWPANDGTRIVPTGEQYGEVVALRIVGRNCLYGWHDASEMDRENPPETIVGEGERVEYAYAQPRPIGVPEPHTKDHYEQDEDEQIDTYSVGHMDGWNSCREAMLAAAPVAGGG